MIIESILRLALPLAARAQILDPSVREAQNNLNQGFRSKAGFSESIKLGDAVYAVINGFISLLAIIFIILVIVAGYSWMTAGGDEAKVTKAKDTIYRAIIGLILTLGAYAITYFVFKYVPFGGSGSGTPMNIRPPGG